MHLEMKDGYVTAKHSILLVTGRKKINLHKILYFIFKESILRDNGDRKSGSLTTTYFLMVILKTKKVKKKSKFNYRLAKKTFFSQKDCQNSI